MLIGLLLQSILLVVYIKYIGIFVRIFVCCQVVFQLSNSNKNQINGLINVFAQGLHTLN